MNIKKRLIRESYLFIAYMGFGFLIFPAVLVAIYILIAGVPKDISFAGELVYFYRSCADGQWLALSAALGPYALHQTIRPIIRGIGGFFSRHDAGLLPAKPDSGNCPTFYRPLY